MRVIAYVHKNSGACYHRLIQPLLAMEDIDIYITNSLEEHHFDKGCQVFIFNRTFPAQAWETLDRLKAKHGFRVCVDVDDYWHLDPHHVLFEYFKDTDYALEQVANLRRADMVFTTHGRLADKIKEHNNNVYVLPNAIPVTGQFNPQAMALKKMTTPYVRLFWQGSITHHQDLGILVQSIQQLQPIARDIKMVMAGFEETEDLWHFMARDYTANFTLPYKIIPGAPVDSYYEAYLHADICLVPLVKSRFNSFKSNLKVLEAAAAGLPAIVSQVDPYLDMPVLYCRSGSDWMKHITRLVSSNKRRKEAAQQLSDFVATYYNFDKINRHRKEILEYVGATL